MDSEIIMLKLIFKHKILETCIDALFDSCIASFSAPILDHSTIYSDILIGYRYDQLVFRIDVPGNDIIIRVYKNCQIKDICWVVSPLDPPIIVFDSDIMYKFVYNRDGRITGHSKNYENHNIHLSTKWLTHKVEMS